MIVVGFATFGCKVNQYDSIEAMKSLSDRFSFVPVSERADVYVINTCTVTAATDRGCRKLVRKIRSRFPSAPIIVAGCYSDRAPGEIGGLDGVSKVVGLVTPDTLASAIEGLAGAAPAGRAGAGYLIKPLRPRTRGVLKIQDGCNERCSYCVVPLVRGRSRSMRPEEVLGAVERLHEAGSAEIVLTGINTGAFGLDLDPPSSLEDLLRFLDERSPCRRLRLSSVEPMYLTDSLLGALLGGGAFCNHLHVPIQSGDDRVLGAMRRPYTRARVEAFMDRTLSIDPDCAMGTDLIAGFPGEGEEEFSRTLEMAGSLRFAYLHVFPFSPRPGTAAAGLPATARPAEVTRRCAVLREAGAALKRERLHGALGKVHQVVVESVEDSYGSHGFTRNYIEVRVKDAGEFVGREIPVRIDEVRDGKALGCPAIEETEGDRRRRKRE